MNKKHPPGPSPRETNPCPDPLPEPDRYCTETAVEGDEGGGTSTLSNNEMKRPTENRPHYPAPPSDP